MDVGDIVGGVLIAGVAAQEYSERKDQNQTVTAAQYNQMQQYGMAPNPYQNQIGGMQYQNQMGGVNYQGGMNAPYQGGMNGPYQGGMNGPYQGGMNAPYQDQMGGMNAPYQGGMNAPYQNQNAPYQGGMNPPYQGGMNAPYQNQMGMPMMPMMPMMPVDGYAILANLPKVLIKEKIKLLEVLTDIEMNNAYSICTPEGNEMFVANETTNICERNCFPNDCGPFRFDISMVPGPGQPRVNLFHAERPCTCTCCCFNRPRLVVTDMKTNEHLATLVDPWACCNLTFQILDSNDDVVMRAVGGCCQWGLCCPLPCGTCSTVQFSVEDAKGGDKIGHIEKQEQGCCQWFFTDADNYEVEFGSVSNPKWKVIMMCLAIFIDFRYFDDRNNQNQNNSPSISDAIF